MKVIDAEGPGSCVVKVVVRVGGFYTLMSFVGAVGFLMNGSGLKEVFESIVASDTVSHLLSGNAVFQAQGAHTIVEAALQSILIK